LTASGVAPRLLLDTHILVWWMAQPRKLSTEQMRALRATALRQEPVAVSAMTLLEIALFARGPQSRFKPGPQEIFRKLEEGSTHRILPLTVEIAREVTVLQAALRDPADSVIVATARVHGLRLLTSDQRILDSNLVSTVA
jgi:PIN domain nuclease of toxin-antitoxin system